MDSTKLDQARARAHDALHDLEREAVALEVERRAWAPGDPEPANAYPFHVHAAPCPSADPWATLCERRVPRDALATLPQQVDCPACIERMEAGAMFLSANALTNPDDVMAMRVERADWQRRCAPIVSDAPTVTRAEAGLEPLGPTIATKATVPTAEELLDMHPWPSRPPEDLDGLHPPGSCVACDAWRRQIEGK